MSDKITHRVISGAYLPIHSAVAPSCDRELLDIGSAFPDLALEVLYVRLALAQNHSLAAGSKQCARRGNTSTLAITKLEVLVGTPHEQVSACAAWAPTSQRVQREQDMAGGRNRDIVRRDGLHVLRFFAVY